MTICLSANALSTSNGFYNLYPIYLSVFNCRYFAQFDLFLFVKSFWLGQGPNLQQDLQLKLFQRKVCSWTLLFPTFMRLPQFIELPLTVKKVLQYWSQAGIRTPDLRRHRRADPAEVHTVSARPNASRSSTLASRETSPTALTTLSPSTCAAHYNFCNKLMNKNVHKISGSRIWTHDLFIISLLHYPLPRPGLSPHAYLNTNCLWLDLNVRSLT